MDYKQETIKLFLAQIGERVCEINYLINQIYETIEKEQESDHVKEQEAEGTVQYYPVLSQE